MKEDELPIPEGAIPEIQKGVDGEDYLVGYWTSEPDRLLTDEEMKPFVHIITYKIDGGVSEELACWDADELTKAQDTKTASIKEQECQERVRGVFGEIEEHMGGDISALKDSRVCMTIYSDWWDALKKKELEDGS